MSPSDVFRNDIRENVNRIEPLNTRIFAKSPTDLNSVTPIDQHGIVVDSNGMQKPLCIDVFAHRLKLLITQHRQQSRSRMNAGDSVIADYLTERSPLIFWRCHRCFTVFPTARPADWLVVTM